MLVTVAMAVYNGERYLLDAVNSILSQTHKNIELIVVNDASTDQTKQILNGIEDERLKAIHLPRNQGAAYALNLAVKYANGEWIAIHDADDISYPNRIEEQVRYINQNPELVAVGSFIECISDTNEVIHDHHLKRNSIQRFNEIKKVMFRGCPLTHGTMFISKRAFYQAGKYNSNYRIAYDYDLWTRLIQIGKIENVPKVLYQYRRYPNSLSSNNEKLTSFELFTAFSNFLHKQKSNKQRKPSYILFGTETGVKTFIAASKDEINIVNSFDYISRRTLNFTLRQRKYKDIDGVILLRNVNKCERLIKKLQSEGLKLDHNLFVFWSAV